MGGGGGNVGAVLTQLIFFHDSKYSTEDGIFYMGIMILACTLPITLIYFPQWGGMFCGPKPDYTAEDYYQSEWSHHEQQKGYSTASLRFAENSVREGGRSAQGSGHSAHTVPVETLPANV